MGHLVTIVASSYSHVRFKQPQQSTEISTEIIDGIKYIWIPTKEYNPSSALGRVKNILEFTFKLHLYRNRLEAANLVICSSHHPLPIYTARFLSKKFHAPLVFEVRDLWPLTLIELGKISKYHPFIRLMQYAEDFAYRHAHKVVSVLLMAKDYMINRGMKPEKFIYIPNGTDLSELEKIQPLPTEHIQVLENLKIGGKFIIGYAGKTGLSNALSTLLDAIHLTDDIQVSLVILGSGPDSDLLKKKADTLGLSNQVHFLEPVSKLQVQDFLRRTDAVYIGALRSLLYRFGISFTKLNDCLLAGRPIIFAVEEPERIVETIGAGIACKAESPIELANAIKQLKSKPTQELNAMGQRGRNWVIENRDYRKLAKEFLTQCID